MKHEKTYIPSQEQWQKVIDNLYSVLPMVLEGGFNINVPEVCQVLEGYAIHSCGTVHCVGGWYLIASERDRIFEYEALEINRKDHYTRNYLEGACYLAQDLGFYYKNELQDWAFANDDLWGNVFGAGMFNNMLAYENPINYDPKTFEDIIHHFEYVKEQCRLYEKTLHV